ncbi:MAG: flagellar hook protein FlgE [Epsilonproteobacteria bacterium]|nr:flagellar hook protein FlgE [Campylobacterota bacterium]
MMTQAFYTGVSGLKSNQTSIDMISDNLANVSTTGFRGYSTEYKSLFEDYLNTAATHANDTGIGVQVSSSTMNNDLGVISQSDRNSDLAILGEGWFGVQNNEDTFYTRAGNFTFDRDNNLVTTDGHYVLGTMGNNISSDNTLSEVVDEVVLGNIETQGKLSFPKSLTFPPTSTTKASFTGNIGLNDEAVSMSASVIDSQNNKNNLKLVFTKATPQVLPGSQWDVVATTQSLDAQTIYDTQNGRVEFDSRGALVSSTLTTIDNNSTPVSIDLGSAFDGVVAIGSMPISSSSESDGVMGGDLIGYSINQNAEVIATFSNSMQSSVGKIAVYHFGNDQGLDRLNGTMFSESNNSGRPLFYQDANGKNINGTEVLNFHLEGSNVKMEVGLTDLIIYQRSYDANAKSVTTADEMMQKALQMDA